MTNNELRAREVRVKAMKSYADLRREPKVGEQAVLLKDGAEDYPHDQMPPAIGDEFEFQVWRNGGVFVGACQVHYFLADDPDMPWDPTHFMAPVDQVGPPVNPLETCVICATDTGKASPDDESFHVNGRGPLCPRCAYRAIRTEEDAIADAIEAAEEKVVEAACAWEEAAVDPSFAGAEVRDRKERLARAVQNLRALRSGAMRPAPSDTRLPMGAFL